jgi:hypothetical protein
MAEAVQYIYILFDSRLVKWGVAAAETDEQIRKQVRQKLIEFAMLVAEEYSQDADRK